MARGHDSILSLGSLPGARANVCVTAQRWRSWGARRDFESNKETCVHQRGSSASVRHKPPKQAPRCRIQSGVFMRALIKDKHQSLCVRGVRPSRLSRCEVLRGRDYRMSQISNSRLSACVCVWVSALGVTKHSCQKSDLFRHT